MKKIISLVLSVVLCLCMVMVLPCFADDADSENGDPAPYTIDGEGDTF